MTVLLLVPAAWVSTGSDQVRCTTYYEQTLDRCQTICSDGSRSITRYDRLLERYQTEITKPLTPKKPTK
jgi:hypothetical protein